MKETDYYPEISRKLSEELAANMPSTFHVAVRQDDYLSNMVREIEEELSGRTSFSQDYVPNVKVDILFGVKKESDQNILLVLLEVKYRENLTLQDYSQLVGYIHVARNIPLGILFLVKKGASSMPLSNDFNELIEMGNLNMDWRCAIHQRGVDDCYDFKTGICWYVEHNGIEWENTSCVRGISSFEDLAAEIKQYLDR